ncbi:hypothetical protein DFH08DRAFT_821909 [Mycena albidolilacea]|uniref:Uncharacterized protein n=1 Tax=Mycena albidolilacea TaxID=1033008 RepID=A0AAD6Z9Z3_9AGAR|nr:hypothetical protein DFH08DRAFT_821909 [Mycena albidolilacea]
MDLVKKICAGVVDQTGKNGAAAAPASGGDAAASGGGGAASSGGGAASGGGGTTGAPSSGGRAVSVIEPDDGDENWVDEDALAGLASTHRSRNSLAPLIRARPKAKRVRVPNTRATERKRRESKAQSGRALAHDLWKAHEDRDKLAEELAETHGMKVKEVKRRLNSGTTFKQKRKTSSYNATVALVMEELNEDLVRGRKYPARVVRRMLKEDPSLGEKFTEQEIEERRMELEQKKLRSMGVRASTKAAALDSKWVMENLAREMTDLAERANMVGFAMFARGDLHDQGIPTSIESRGALKFFRDVFQKSPEDVLTLFEMWAVTKNKEGEGATTLAELQKACGDMIRNGLKLITGKANIAMNFQNYIKTLVLGRGVGLLVWPDGVDFKRMGKQSSLAPLRILFNHLKDGRTKWVKLSRKQQDKILEEFKEMVQERKLEEKIRNTRSDKGGRTRSATQGGEFTAVDKDEDDNDDNEDNNNGSEDEEEQPAHSKKPSAPVKKAPATKKPTAPKKSSSASGAKPSRKRGAVDHAEEPPKKKRQGNTDKGDSWPKKRKLREEEEEEEEEEERPRKKKKPAELKRLEKQMSKGKEKSQEE